MTDRSIDTIDTLVLDWIVRSGNLSTFSKLPTSSSSLGEAEKESLMFRAEVSELIKVGRMAEAIEMIEAANLNTEPEHDHSTSLKISSTKSLQSLQSRPINLDQILFILRLQHFIELIRQKNTSAALSFVQNNLIPLAGGEFEEVLEESLGVLVYNEPENSPLNWLFERTKRYSMLASLTNSALFHIQSKSSFASPLEIFLKHTKVFYGLVQEIDGLGNELDDRKWSSIRELLYIENSGKNNIVKVVKTD